MGTHRVIVVGAGNIAKAWVPGIVAEGVEVAGVVDIREEAGRELVERFGLPAGTPVYGELGRALREVRADFVLDLTVPEAHCGVTLAALRAGLHVLGEKPMAASMAEAREMVRVAGECGRMYMVSQSRRWENPHPAIAATCRDGRLGEMTEVHCDFFIGAHFGGFREAMDSPLLLDMAIHHFDLARYFTGADAVSVYAEESNPRGSWYRGAASAVCIFEMTGGVRFTYRGSWCAEGCHTSWNGNWRVVGTRGTLVYENDRWPRGQVVAGEEGFHRPVRELEVAEVRAERTAMRGALGEMLEFLRTGRRPQTECGDNIKSLGMVFGAMESARGGGRVGVCM